MFIIYGQRGNIIKTGKMKKLKGRSQIWSEIYLKYNKKGKIKKKKG